MKIITTIGFSFLFCGAVFSQDLDKRLLTKYTSSELTTMMEVNPEKYAMLDYALDNAIYFSEIPNEKNQNFETIQLSNDSATFIELGLEIKDQNQYFKVVGENRLLVVKSMLVLNYEMNKK
jgi:hypothetical protein